MRIRQATVNDVHTLVQLNAQVQQVHTDALPVLFKPPVDDEIMRQLYVSWLIAPEHYFYIGEVDSEPVGYVFAKIVERPENPFTYAWKYVYIDQISVNAEHRSKGYGKQLMQAVYDLARAQNIERIALDVWSFNEDAQHFYEHIGFSACKVQMEVYL